MKSFATHALVAATIASAAMAVPASAREVPMSVEVRYSDLDLSTEAGQRTLDRRIQRAAEQICDIDRRRGMALPTLESRLCYRQVVEELEPRVAAIVAAERRG